MSRMPLFQQKWAERKLSLKNWDVVLNTYIAPDIYFPLTAVLCLNPNIMKLKRLFFYFLWKWSVPMSRWPICFQYPLNGSLGMPWLMMLCRALRLRYWQRFVNAGEQVRSLQNAPSRNSSYWPNCYHGANKDRSWANGTTIATRRFSSSVIQDRTSDFNTTMF